MKEVRVASHGASHLCEDSSGQSEDETAEGEGVLGSGVGLLWDAGGGLAA